MSKTCPGRPARGRPAESPSFVSCEPHADGELGLGCELAGGGFGGVGRLDPHDLDAAVGADDREAVGGNLNDLSELAADALGIARWDRLGIENLQHLAVELRPGAGRGIAAADQIVDLPPGLAPIDAGVLGGAAAFVSGRALVLLEAGR